MNTTAKIIKDSFLDGIRVVTMEITFPRFILPEFNTHRVFSRSFQSSRAVPTARLISDWATFIPEAWSQNQAGMQAKDLLSVENAVQADIAWRELREEAIQTAKRLAELGVHKQQANRVLEPFLYVKGIVTSTKWDNFFDLRCHPDAQPEFQTLASLMQSEYLNGKPVERLFHIPYVMDEDLNRDLYPNQVLDLIRVSVARCARVSYKMHDGSETTLEKDLDLYTRLVGAVPIHASPAEHQAISFGAAKFLIGAEFINIQNHAGNFESYTVVQYRKLLEHFQKKFSSDVVPNQSA